MATKFHHAGCSGLDWRTVAALASPVAARPSRRCQPT
jgi:hypothetical protein